MGGAPELGHWTISQTLACRPGSTQPGGTAKDEGSHPTAEQNAANSQGHAPSQAQALDMLSSHP